MSFFHELEQYSKSTAIFTQSTRHTYDSLIQDADEIGSNVENRSVVFLICQNILESVAGYVGLLRAGAVPVLLRDSLDSKHFANLLECYHPHYIFLPAQNSLSEIAGSVVLSKGSYLLIKTPYAFDYPVHPDLALLLTTSGSTGNPKFVRQSYRNIRSNTDAITQCLGISDEDRAITTMPMNYTYGLSIITTHLMRGAALILTNKTLMDKTFWETLKERQATTFGGVPFFYEMLKKLRFGQMHLPALKYLTQAGGKLNLTLASEFAHLSQEKKFKFYVMYGQTEATARMSYLPNDYSIVKSGSIGVPIPGGRFWLEDEQGKTISDSETPGELVYAGDNVSLGYAENFTDLNKGDENSGILRTGDVAKRDLEGFYYIVGRKKRFLKVYGLRVNLDDIEQFMRAEGLECACAGTDDNVKIYLTDRFDKDHLKTYLANRTGINQAAFQFVSVKNLPRNEEGKVRYAALE